MERTDFVKIPVLVNKSIVLECLPHDKLVLLGKHLGFLPN